VVKKILGKIGEYPLYSLWKLNGGKLYPCLFNEGNGYTCFLKVDPLIGEGSKC